MAFKQTLALFKMLGLLNIFCFHAKNSVFSPIFFLEKSGYIHLYVYEPNKQCVLFNTMNFFSVISMKSRWCPLWTAEFDFFIVLAYRVRGYTCCSTRTHYPESEPTCICSYYLTYLEEKQQNQFYRIIARPIDIRFILNNKIFIVWN